MHSAIRCRTCPCRATINKLLFPVTWKCIMGLKSHKIHYHSFMDTGICGSNMSKVDHKMADLLISNSCNQWHEVQSQMMYTRGWYCIQYCVIIFSNGPHNGMECTFGVCRWNKIERSGWYTTWLCCHSEGPQQSGERGKQELIKVKEKYKAQHPARNIPVHQSMMRDKWLKNSSAEKDTLQ